MENETVIKIIIPLITFVLGAGFTVLSNYFFTVRKERKERNKQLKELEDIKETIISEIQDHLRTLHVYYLSAQNTEKSPTKPRTPIEVRELFFGIPLRSSLPQIAFEAFLSKLPSFDSKDRVMILEYYNSTRLMISNIEQNIKMNVGVEDMFDVMHSNAHYAFENLTSKQEYSKLIEEIENMYREMNVESKPKLD